MVEFGKRLRQLRKARNLTQKQLAELIGVKNSVISFCEVGERMPSSDALRKLALALHTTTDYPLDIDRGVMVDTSGLNEADCMVVQTIIAHLREKNSP